MPGRTTSSAVRSLGNFRSTQDLTGYIETASCLVDKVEEAGETDENVLELIERWLAAHMVSVTVDPQVSSKQIDITEIQWQVAKGGDNLMATPYGRMAMALDSTHTLEDCFGTLAKSMWIGDDEPYG